LERGLRQLANGEGDAQVFDQEICNRTWEQLLSECYLIVITGDGHELAFSDIAPKAAGALE
jgi:hypothetical protein